MKIPSLDVGATYRELAPEIDEAVQRVLAPGRYVLGEERFVAERYSTESLERGFWRAFEQAFPEAG